MEEESLTKNIRIYEYTSAVVPEMPEIPVLRWGSSLHESGASRIIPFDVSQVYGYAHRATSPNLLAAFIRICEQESVESFANATSQAFYVIQGEGTTVASSSVEGGNDGNYSRVSISWKTGDLFVIPASCNRLLHTSVSTSSLYWVSDEPLLSYLGVSPSRDLFSPTYYSKERLLSEVEKVKHQDGAGHRNRMGVLLGNAVTHSNTKTITPTLWSLLNTLPPHEAQPPHRHNSVAIDLCVYAAAAAAPVTTTNDGTGEGNCSGVYTLMGPELGEDGWVKDPVRCDWSTGSVFTTPPGWWHSHHNETDEYAWVLPMQDAGIHLNSRTLDIQFSTATPKKV